MTLRLLDPTFLIDTDRSATALDDLIAGGGDVAIAAVTRAELRVGVELAGASRPARRQSCADEIAASIPNLPDDQGVAMRDARAPQARHHACSPPGQGRTS